jgi:hypothetical protein
MTQIVLDVDRRKIEHTYTPNAFEYGMSVGVSTSTDPGILRSCLVIQRGDYSLDERLIRIATWNDLFSTVLPTLPAVVNKISSVTCGPIGAGVTVVISTPKWWQSYFSVPSTISATTVNTSGTLDTTLPSFARNLRINVGGTLYIDGVANRTYTSGATYFSTYEHCNVWDSLEGALNRYTALSLEAKSLLDAYNSDLYTQISKKVII